MSIYAKTAAGWVEVAGGGSKAALSSWGRVVGEPTGAVTTTYFSNDDGSQWQYWEFNSEGTYEIDLGNGGLFWVLCVGGGDNGIDANNRTNQGQPGLVNEGLWEFGPGTHTVTVGIAGGSKANPPGQPSSIGDYGTQGVSSWGAYTTGRGGQADDDNTGYKSRITGDELEYATGRNGLARPGRGGYNGDNLPGCVIIATRIDVEQLAPAPAELAPAPVLGAPVKVSGSADVLEYVVRQTDGSRKKIYMLPGNTTAGGDENVFEVTLGAGVLPGVMVAAGGQGGVAIGTGGNRGGPGGAGGVIGQGAHVPVILPVQGTATYTIRVPSSGQGTHVHHPANGRDCSIAVQGQTPFATAVGGGKGTSGQDGRADVPGRGGSGGGSGNWAASEPDATPGIAAYANGGEGIAGQGFPGGEAYGGPYIGGGGGYSERGHREVGGKGFDLAAAFDLNKSDGPTAAFLAAVTDDGWIAGGGSFTLNGFETYPGGGGGRNGTMSDGQAYTGGGGSGGDATAHVGGCGAVYIITDAS